MLSQNLSRSCLGLAALALAATATAQLPQTQVQVAGLGAIKASFDASTPTGNGLILGVAYLSGEYYVSGGGGGALNRVYVLDGTGALVRDFAQFSTTSFGYRDGASDGVSVMFGCEDGIYVLDPMGNQVNSVVAANGPQMITNPIAGPGLAALGIYRGVAYNPYGNGGNGSIWTATFGSDLLEIDLAGNILGTYPNNVGWSVYGLAWDPYTQTLLMNSVPNAGDIVQYDPTTDMLGGVITRTNPGSAQGGLSAIEKENGWDVVGIDQAAPDTLTRYRVHLWTQPFRNGFDEGRMLTAVDSDPLDANPVKLVTSGASSISLEIEELPGYGRRPAFLSFNVGADALINGVTQRGKSFLIPEFVALTRFSDPVGTEISAMVMTGRTLTLPVPMGLMGGDYIRAQAITINPAGRSALCATNQMFWLISDCFAIENFDNLPLGAGNYPAGWANGGGTLEWQVDANGTPSSGTGPSTAVSQPNYMYCETSSPATTGSTYIMNTAVYPGASLTGVLKFQLSRVGATTGTLEVRMDDGSGTFSTLLATYTGEEPNGLEWTAESITLPSPLPANVQFQFHYTRGSSFTGDIAIDDFCIE